MELALMRFKGFTMWCNPQSIEIENERTSASYTLPFCGERQSDLGRKCRVIKGKGELTGKDCLEQYARLYMLFESGGEGVLSLPHTEPLKAVFESLSSLADVTPDRISYSFKFVETSSEEKKTCGKIHKVSRGETLFDIAFNYGVSVDCLVKLNPSVRRPDELSEGEEIKIC